MGTYNNTIITCSHSYLDNPIFILVIHCVILAYIGYKLGTFGTTVVTSDSFQNQTFTDARSSWKNNHSLKNGSFESSTATDFDNPVYAKNKDEQKGSKPASLNEWASDAEDVVVSSVTVHIS